jgi:hypothetical protein
MATDELVLSGAEQRFHVSATPIARLAGTALARLAVTAVLAVCGSAVMLAVLAVLQESPLTVVAAIVVASWCASARFLDDLDRA